jgi:CheY-like chemotaxis protein
LPLGSELILVVEDDQLVREFASTQLRSLGYRVIEAADGREALEILHARKGIALLFTDIVMPHGFDGRALAQLARERQPDLRVLFTSGYAESAMTRLDRLREGIVLLSKPYRKRELAEKVRFVLEEAQLCAE